MTIDLENITLAAGAHDSPDNGTCLLEAVSYVAGERFTDHPKCVSPVLGAYGRRLNDRLGDEDRQKLKPFIPLMIGTAGDGFDETRRWLASDWAVRAATPRWLHAAGMWERAAELRALPRIVDHATVKAARGVARAARDEAWAVRLEARESLRSKVREELEQRGVKSVAAADADADAAAAAPRGVRYSKVYDAVHAKLETIYRAAFDDSKYAEVTRVNNEEAIALLGLMIDPTRVA